MTPARKRDLRFTEEMKGWISFVEERPTGGAAPLSFHLTIAVEDMDRFATDPGHEAFVTAGHVECQALGGELLPVDGGTINLLVGRGRNRRMLYRLFFHDEKGYPLTLSGFKILYGARLWADTTTLFTFIREGHVGPYEEARASLIAAGTVRIRPLGLLKLITTFRPGGPILQERAGNVCRFARLFLGGLLAVYAPLPTTPTERKPR